MGIAVYVSVIVCLIAFPSHTAQTAKSALALFASDIVPSLYPYMVFSRLLCRKLNMQRIKPFPLIAVLGLLGGSPSGASLLAGFSGGLNPQSLRALCALTGTISPMFFLGAMSVWIGDSGLCRMLLISHWTGAILSAITAFFFSSGQHAASPMRVSAINSKPESAFLQSADAILQVGGCIICYSVAAGLLTALPGFQHTAGAVLQATLEVSGGAHALCRISLPMHIKYPLLAFLCGFGGCSILSQNASMLEATGISKAELIVFALLRGAGSMLTMCALMLLFSA